MKLSLMLMVMLSLLQEISNNIDNWYFRQESMAIEVVFKNLGF